MFMRAATVSRFGGPEAIEITEVPVPDPGPGQARVKVAAAALNPVDAAMRAGVFGGAGERVGLGWDVAGIVDSVGPGGNWFPGDRVIGLATGHHTPLGTHAEYVVLPAEAIAPAPATLDDIHASALPLNTLSAAQALDMAGLQPGQSLLVTGAAGGVGGHTVELAHHRGLEVTAVASPRDEQFLRSRGADHFLPRDATLPAAAFDGTVDAAVLGGAALAAIRDDGAYVGVWPGQEPAPERGIRIGALDVHADGTGLAELTALADQGVVLARVTDTFPLADAAAAHARLAEGGLRGRIVLVPRPVRPRTMVPAALCAAAGAAAGHCADAPLPSSRTRTPTRLPPSTATLAPVRRPRANSRNCAGSAPTPTLLCRSARCSGSGRSPVAASPDAALAHPRRPTANP